MSQENNTRNIGLRGIHVADTSISQVDGVNGELIYRGYNIKELAMQSTFEEVAYLLLHDDLPTVSELEEFSRTLIAHRQIRPETIEFLSQLLPSTQPMDMLQATIPQILP